MLELSASSESSLLATNPRLIHLYLTAQRFPRVVPGSDFWFLATLTIW